MYSYANPMCFIAFKMLSKGGCNKLFLYLNIPTMLGICSLARNYMRYAADGFYSGSSLCRLSTTQLGPIKWGNTQPNRIKSHHTR